MLFNYIHSAEMGVQIEIFLSRNNRNYLLLKILFSFLDLLFIIDYEI